MSLSTAQIIDEINRLHTVLKTGKTIKFIHGKAAGLAMIEKLTAQLPKAAPKAKSTEPKAARSSLNFAPKDFKRVPMQNTLRAEVLSMLKHGATFAEVEALVLKTTRKTPEETASYRAYKVIRHMNTKFGYGVKHDPVTGIIKVYS